MVPIQAAYGWRTSFYVFGILGVIWAVVWFSWFRDHPSQKKEVTPEELREIGAASKPPAHLKLPWARVAGSGNFWVLLLMYHLFCYNSFFYLSWYPTYLVSGRGFNEDDLLRYSWLPYVLGALANMLGGFTSDRLVKKIGLKWGRRAVGIIGLGGSAVFISATLLTQDKFFAVVFLALGFAGSDFMLPVAWAVCLDIGRKYAGTVTGAMNTAGQLGSFFLSAGFGFVVRAYGSYDAPLYPMIVFTICACLLWFAIDPTKQLVPDEEPRAPAIAA